LERFHVSATYSHWVLEATRNRKAGSRSGEDRAVIPESGKESGEAPAPFERGG
jgi:hypothetical protein